MFKIVRNIRGIPAFGGICFNVSLSKSLIENTSISRCFSSQSHTVQMRGLDYETKEQDVIDFFKPLGITPKSIRLKCDGAGRVAGVSEVDFNTHAEAVVAMRKRNAFMGNRFIRLALKSELGLKESKKTEPVDPKTSSTSKVGLNLLTEIDKASFPVGHFIRMKNAPRRTTDQTIYDFFWPVGVHPISVKPIYNESGLRTGDFDVQFLSREDAYRAMAKNNAYLGTKFVELSILKT